MTEAVPEGYKELFDVIADVLHLYEFDKTDFKCSGLVSRVKQSRKKGEIDFTKSYKGVRYYQVDKFERWAKPHIEDMEVFEYKEIRKFEDQRKKNKAILERKNAESEIKGIDDVNKKKKTRKTRIRLAVEAAYSALFSRLGKRPSADEVLIYLKNEDSTGYIVDSYGDKIIWEDTKGDSHKSSYKSVANILSKVHGEMTNI